MLTFMRKHMKLIIGAVAFIFAATMFYGIGYQGIRQLQGQERGEGGRGLASVNGKEISGIRYGQSLARLTQNLADLAALPYMQNVALSQTIEFELILSEARKKVKVFGREVDESVKNIMDQQKVKNISEFKRLLDNAGYSYSDFKNLLRDDILVQKMVNKIKEGAEVRPEDYKEIRARHILISSESEAKKILAEVIKGGNFARLAEKHSIDPGSGKRGGDLDYFSVGAMVPEFERAAFALKPGEVSGIIKTNYGYHIIKVEDSRLRKINVPSGRTIDDAVKEEKQRAALNKWLFELKRKAKIEVLDPSFRAYDFILRGQMDQAIAEYKKAVSQEPSNLYLHLFLGNAYRNSNQKDLALAEYKKASLLAGENKKVLEALLKTFKELKIQEEVSRIQGELARITKREEFFKKK